jgi:hypothetical protein
MHIFELLAEEKIRAAEREGAFDNLPGAGKPLALDDDRLVPEELRAGYRILKNAGFVPPEIDARKEALSLQKLITVTTDEEARKRALTRLALIETCLGSRGTLVSRSPYYDRIVERLNRE